MNTYTQTFEITANKSQITFNRKGVAKKIRFNRIIYKTASANNYAMLIILSGWNSGKDFNYIPYTILHTLPRTTLAETDALRSDKTSWDVEKPNGDYIGTHNLECIINGDFTNTDISGSNKLYIEIEVLFE